MKYLLAPLAGFTDAPFRRLCHEGGADLCYTEMVSAAGLAHGNSPTRQLLETMPGEGPVALQLFGAKPDEMATAVRSIFPAPFTELNLNAGCPVPKVTQCGAGSALIKDPGRVYELLAAMRENSPVPVTLKTRLGPHPQAVRIFELLNAAERAGCAALIVHARFTSQNHGGPVHLDLLKEVCARSTIPVIGNGSIVDAASARAMAATGVAGLMIGRAALPNPFIFEELKRALASASGEVGAESERGDTAYSPWVPRGGAQPTPRRHLDYLLSFRDQLVARFPDDHIPSPDAYASVKMHVHLFRYFNGRPGAAKLRQRLNSVRTLAEIREIMDAFE